MNSDREAEEEYFSEGEIKYENSNELWGDIWES